MIKFNNYFFFFFFNSFFYDKKNLFFSLKIFSLKLKFKIFNDFLKISNSVLILKKSHFLEKNILNYLENNKNDILFFYLNKKLYNKNNIKIILNKNFFNINILHNFNNYFFNFFFLIKKLYLLIQINNTK